MKHKEQLILTFILVLTLLSTPVWAMGGSEGGPGNGPGKIQPPQEAFDACMELQENDPCFVVMPDGNEAEGICKTISKDLVCFPNDMPEPPYGDRAAPPIMSFEM